MYLTTIMAQHLDLQVQAVSTVYSIFTFDIFYIWDVMLYSTIYLPNCTASHHRGQIFIAKDSRKSHIYVWVLCGDAEVEGSAKTKGQHQGDVEDI